MILEDIVEKIDEIRVSAEGKCLLWFAVIYFKSNSMKFFDKLCTKTHKINVFHFVLRNIESPELCLHVVKEN